MGMDRIDKSTVVGRNLLERFQRGGGQAGEAGRAGGAPSPASPQPVEKVEISARARRLADLRGTLAAAREAYDAQGDDPEATARLDRVRARLASGAYDSDEVRRAVAGKLAGVLRRLSEL